MATVELKNKEWEDFSKAEYAIIDCYGDHCFACVMLEPVFDGIADELAEISFGRINISKYSEIADIYSIDAMPTLLFFRNGSVVDKVVGSIDREEFLKHISNMLYQ